MSLKICLQFSGALSGYSTKTQLRFLLSAKMKPPVQEVCNVFEVPQKDAILVSMGRYRLHHLDFVAIRIAVRIAIAIILH